MRIINHRIHESCYGSSQVLLPCITDQASLLMLCMANNIICTKVVMLHYTLSSSFVTSHASTCHAFTFIHSKSYYASKEPKVVPAGRQGTRHRQLLS